MTGAELAAVQASCKNAEHTGRKWERLAVLRAIDKELSDWTNSSQVAGGAREALNALRKTIENGDHVK